MSSRQRRRLRQMAIEISEIKAGGSLMGETKDYLVEFFQRVSDGEDPNDVLGLSEAVGEKEGIDCTPEWIKKMGATRRGTDNKS